MAVLWKFALRDAAIVAATILLWNNDAAQSSWGHGPGTATAVAAGLMTPVCGFVLHEWGHLLGALWARSQIAVPARPWALFLFRFDPSANSREQFLAMSCGGFAASAMVIAALCALLPFRGLAPGIAWSLTGLGVLATGVFEIPPAWRALRRGRAPEPALRR